MVTTVLLALAAATTGEAALIGIDAVHGYDREAVLATGEAFDTFRAVLTGLGHTLVPLDRFDAAALAGLDAVILATPYRLNHHPYSAEEVEALHAFATHAAFVGDTTLWQDPDTASDRPITFGDNRRLLENLAAFLVAEPGGLLLAADAGNAFDAEALNRIAAPYGVTFYDRAVAPFGYTETAFAPHPVADGLSAVGVDFAVPLVAVAPPAVALDAGDRYHRFLAVADAPRAAAREAVRCSDDGW
ncbi:MAG: hypothetical protein D6739_05030 [Nitrospirae bacterium]|nr:MAG: hypothetical protein D6739_05030 [Nitrospirota bacterium]